MSQNEYTSPNRAAELKKQRELQALRRAARAQKRKPKALAELPKIVREQTFVFTMSPSATKNSAYIALIRSDTLKLYSRKFIHEDVVRKTVVQGSFEVVLLFTIGQQVLRELAPHWQLGKLGGKNG